ncbi:acyltransferase [Malikia sp.]|uniref:acyltransferase family protein n=1 Tax=Malikia sp. TaxID=2070706 RepID=UPI0026143DC7|nr:acyltransferase [Malikia sp.]MDD2727800.1 acyltransferase [Malikia sp.]
MTPNISHSINLLRVISIFLVLILHARTNIDFSVEWVAAWSDIASRGFGALGVPIFLVISGYLAGIKRTHGAAAETWTSWQRRVKGLLAGYVFWNSLVALLVLFAVWLNFSMGSFLSGKLAGGWLSIFGLNDKFPIAYQFWFIRELLIFSTMVFFVERLAAWSRLLAFVMILAVVVAFFEVDGRSQMAALAYMAGYLAGHNDVVVSIMNAHCRHHLWLATMGATALLSLAIAAIHQDWNGLALLSFMALGTVSLMGGAIGLVSKGWRLDALARWAPATFFIFAAHEPLLALLRKMLIARVGPEWAYVAAPTVVVVVLISLYKLVPEGLKARVWFVFSGAPRRQERASA